MDVTRMRRRWVLLAGAVIVMMFIAIYQYSWSLFASGLNSNLGWSMTTIQAAFTLYTYAATFVQPLSGYFADKFGPRKIAVLAGLLAALGLSLNYMVSSPLHLYTYYALGSIGVGMLYGISTSIAVKWFPDKRGLATGIVTFGFGAGTAIFNVPIQSWISNYSVKTAFLYTGILMLIFIMPFTLLYSYPETAQTSERQRLEEGGDAANWRWHEMLKTGQWWLIYISFSIMAAIALLFGAHIVPMAKASNISANVLSLALVAYPLANGFSRVLGGLISDHVGRQITATLFYTLAGAMMIALSFTASNPIGFASFVVLTMLFAGSVFAFNPALIGDFYGPRYSTTNYGITYTAKSWGGLISGYVTAYFSAALNNNYAPLTIGLGTGALIAAVLVSPWLLKKPRKKDVAEARSP
ncbi:MAG: OFA family MFS transporter [Candidatus Bathyarchaeia archaeon]